MEFNWKKFNNEIVTAVPLDTDSYTKENSKLRNSKLDPHCIKLLTYAVANPWTVMIKLCNTAVTHRAVLRAYRAPYQTRATEPLGFKSTTFCQLYYRL